MEGIYKRIIHELKCYLKGLRALFHISSTLSKNSTLYFEGELPRADGRETGVAKHLIILSLASRSASIPPCRISLILDRRPSRSKSLMGRHWVKCTDCKSSKLKELIKCGKETSLNNNRSRISYTTENLFEQRPLFEEMKPGSPGSHRLQNNRPGTKLDFLRLSLEKEIRNHERKKKKRGMKKETCDSYS